MNLFRIGTDTGEPSVRSMVETGFLTDSILADGAMILWNCNIFSVCAKNRNIFSVSKYNPGKVINSLLVNNLYPAISYRRCSNENESDELSCYSGFGHSLRSANRLPAQAVTNLEIPSNQLEIVIFWNFGRKSNGTMFRKLLQNSRLLQKSWQLLYLAIMR